MFVKKYTPEQSLQKIRHYCSYQERSHSEVLTKLYSYGLRKMDVDILISKLIEDDYLNETRFANLFAGGRFRQKKWGKVKIKYELKLKKVSEYNIRKALSNINQDEYEEVLAKLAKQKWMALKHEQYITRQAKTTSYLMQRGFEPELIKATIAKIRSSAND